MIGNRETMRLIPNLLQQAVSRHPRPKGQRTFATRSKDPVGNFAIAAAGGITTLGNRQQRQIQSQGLQHFDSGLKLAAAAIEEQKIRRRQFPAKAPGHDRGQAGEIIRRRRFQAIAAIF